MNHYPRHIGDWRSATYNLTRVQRDIYSALLDTYYDKEQPLTADMDMLAEDHGCRTVEERDALAYILRRYFKRDGAAWRHERCDEEIAAFHNLINVRSKAGKASGSARAQRRMNTTGTRVEQTGNTPPAESNTGATTQYPIPNTHPVSPDGEQGGEHAASPPAPTPAPPPPAPTPPAPPEKPASGASRPTRKAPKDFTVTPDMAQWAAEKCPLLTIADIERETEMFRNHTFGRAISDWLATWRNWLLKEQKFRESKPQYQTRLNGPAADRKARGESFMAAVIGDSNAGSQQGAIDVESRVVRDGEEHPSE